MSRLKAPIGAMLTILFLSIPSLAKDLDLDHLLFGIEYTFQDAQIIKENGRTNIRENPYKLEKEDQMTQAYTKALGLPESAISEKTSWKKGWYIDVPGDGKFIVNAEPVTIEVNTTPRKYSDIEETAEVIFKAADMVELVPYVQPAAERSGMGHIHIGGTSLGKNPFYQSPHLLRNMMVAYHKHPSLLWGFAEAFDIGPQSNIETYHYGDRQEKFENAVASFDKSQRDIGALQSYLQSLVNGGDLLHHYRFINLEHFQGYAKKEMNPNDDGKITVEFRTFRPPSSPQMAKSYAGLLIGLMEAMNTEGYLEPFKRVSEDEYKLFHTVDYIRRDWERVKAKYKLNDPLLEESIEEYFKIFESTEIPHNEFKEIKISMASSPKELKSQFYQLAVESAQDHPPQVRIAGGEPLNFTWIETSKGARWVTFIDASASNFNHLDIQKGVLDLDLNFARLSGSNSSHSTHSRSGGVIKSANTCSNWF